MGCLLQQLFCPCTLICATAAVDVVCAGGCMMKLPPPFTIASPQHSACAHMCLPGASAWRCRLSDAEVEAAVASKRAELLAELEAEKQADGDK